VDALLVERYGDKQWAGPGDPMAGLVRTILSQNTTDVNSHQAYQRLRERFPTWAELAAGRPQAIARAIEVGGLGQIKAGYIRDLLRKIRRQEGDYSLDALADMPVEEGMARLTGYRGVGPKTAACVLLFQLGRPVFPVDTHVNRIAGRLGWVTPESPAGKTQAALSGAVPPELCYRLHLNLVQHGRRCCRTRKPDCPSCPVAAHCQAMGG